MPQSCYLKSLLDTKLSSLLKIFFYYMSGLMTEISGRLPWQRMILKYSAAR